MSGSVALILVTGATGRHGSTGAHVARRLREEGRPVRILARTLSERTDALAARCGSSSAPTEPNWR